MPYIEIKTVHNVVVAYETAKWMDRLFAFLIDCVLVFFALCFVMAGVAIMGLSDNEVVVMIVTVPPIAIYHLVCESLMDGQSVGKKAMGIKVVKLTGREVSFQDYFIRWVFRIVDILFSLGTLAVILVNSSNKGQRLGDVLANTVVVRTRPDRAISLNSISAIRTLETYEPRYGEATKLTEEQALLIKNVLDRYKKYPNTTSERLLRELGRKLTDELRIQDVKQNIPDFLRTILKDYVVLTR